MQGEHALPPPRLRWQRMTSGQFKRKRHDRAIAYPSSAIAPGGVPCRIDVSSGIEPLAGTCSRRISTALAPARTIALWRREELQ
jgi:hypothetical protein